MAYSIITVLADGEQLTASGYRTMESVLAHIDERVRMRKLSASALPSIRCFVIVGPDGETVRKFGDGVTASGKQTIQAWYAQERSAT